MLISEKRTSAFSNASFETEIFSPLADAKPAFETLKLLLVEGILYLTGGIWLVLADEDRLLNEASTGPKNKIVLDDLTSTSR